MSDTRRYFDGRYWIDEDEVLLIEERLQIERNDAVAEVERLQAERAEARHYAVEAFDQYLTHEQIEIIESWREAATDE